MDKDPGFMNCRTATDNVLRSNIASLSSTGHYGEVWGASRAELDRRGVNYLDCLSPEEMARIANGPGCGWDS